MLMRTAERFGLDPRTVIEAWPTGLQNQSIAYETLRIAEEARHEH